MNARSTNLALAASILALAVLASVGRAQNTWVGNGTDASWADAGNWDVLPDFDGSEEIVLGTGFGSGTPTLPGVARDIDSLTITASIGNVTLISGSTLVLYSGDITRTSAGGTQTIATAINLGDPAVAAGTFTGTWTNDGTGNNRIQFNNAIEQSHAGPVWNLEFTGGGETWIQTGSVNHRGNTTIMGGSEVVWTAMPGGGDTGTVFGDGTIILDDGTFSMRHGNNGNRSLNNDIVVNAGGGTLSERHAGNSHTYFIRGTISGAGDLTLMHSEGGNGVTHFMADNSGFAGALTIHSPGGNTGSAMVFRGQNTVPGGAGQTVTFTNSGAGIPKFGSDAGAHTYTNAFVLNSAMAFRPFDVTTYAGDITTNGNAIHLNGPNLLIFQPGAGSDMGNSNFVLNDGALQVSAMSDLPGGNLNLSGGAFVLDGSGNVAPTWAQFSTARSEGTGNGQYQGSGFAAMGTDAVLDGVDVNRNLTLGSMSALTDAAIILDTDTTLTGNRTFTVAGLNVASNSGNWQLNSPVHEITADIGGEGNLSFTVTGASQGGTIRLSGDNTFEGGVNIGTAGGNANPDQAIVVIASGGDNALGELSNVVTVGGSAERRGALLLFDDPTGTGTTFTRDIHIQAPNHNSRGGNTGTGSFEGISTYTGTITIGTGGNERAWQFHTHGTSTLVFDGASIDFHADSNSGGIHTFFKGGTGTLDLGDVTVGGAPRDHKWRLVRGTLITREQGQLDGSNLQDLLGGSGFTLAVRDNDQTYSGLGTDAAYSGQSGVDVADGLTLTLNTTARIEGSGADARLVKTGGGTLILHSTNTGNNNNGDGGARVVAAEGILDFNSNAGRSGGLVDGGTLLIRNGLGWGSSDNRAFEIGPNGGKVGIATVGSGNVSRGALSSWDQSGTSTVTFASRGDDSLVFGGWSGNTVGSNTTLLIDHDGAPGTGVVQININDLNVDGTLGGSGTLRLQAGGTGSVNLAAGATLSPGSSPGILSIDGNLNLVSGTFYDWEFLSMSSYDQTHVAGTLSLDVLITLRISDAGILFDPNDGFLVNPTDELVLFSYGLMGQGVPSWQIEGVDLPEFWDISGATVFDNEDGQIILTGIQIGQEPPVIPEPGSALLLGLGALALTALRRRRED